MFAVLDFETTGFFGNHRVIEIGVVLLDDQLQVESIWETLVQPNRDVGAEITKITGLRASDLRDAPTFEEIAPLFWRQLEGRVLVAHSLSFETRMLELELGRLDARYDLGAGVCTRQLAQRVVSATDQLCDVARSLGIEMPQSHRALNDARIATSVFQHLAAHVDGNSLAACTAPQLVSKVICTECFVRSEQPALTPDLNLAGLAAAKPTERIEDDDPALCEYLTLVDQVVEDHIVTADEMKLVQERAAVLRLGQSDMQSANVDYLRRFALAILADRKVTDGERRDFMMLANLLGCENAADMLSEIGDIGTMPTTDLAGKTVCFTGDSHCSIDGIPLNRERATALARDKGLEVQGGVSKRLDILVLSDPHSMSGKAKKAREYGTRLVAERMFWMKLGYKVD